MFKRLKPFQHSIYGLIIYYWCLALFFPNEENVERFSLLYFSFISPVALFVLAYISKALRRDQPKECIPLLLFVLVVIPISLYRFDFSSVLNTILFIGIITILLSTSNSGVHINFINWLFILSLVGSIITTHIGINQYGYLPNVWEGRISLFPAIPESALFCTLVIVINYLYSVSLSRYLYYIFAFYFLLFSGSKTAIVILAAFILFIIIAKFIQFNRSVFYSVYNLIVLLILLGIISLGSAINIIHKFNSPTINKIIFDTEQPDDREVINKTSSTRLWIWEQHSKIFSNNILMGVGSFSMTDYARLDPLIQYTSSTGSESFLTGQLARFGLPALLLIVFLFTVQQRALVHQNKLKYFLVFFLIFSMMVYGSYIVAYNFLFLIVISLFRENQIYVRS